MLNKNNTTITESVFDQDMKEELFHKVTTENFDFVDKLMDVNDNK